MAAIIPHPSMNDTPSYSEQNVMLPHLVHLFHVLIFHFRQQIIIWRTYGVIAEVLDHSSDDLNTWKPFAFSHTDQCLLATDSLRHLARWGNTMLPHQVPNRVFYWQRLAILTLTRILNDILCAVRIKLISWQEVDCRPWDPLPTQIN